MTLEGHVLNLADEYVCIAVDAGGAPVIEGVGKLAIAACHQHGLEAGASDGIVHACPLAAQGRLGHSQRALGGMVDKGCAARDAGGNVAALDEHAVVDRKSVV